MNEKLEELVKDLEAYDKLRGKLWNLCNEYAKSNVLPQELKEYKFGYYEFQDFMLGKNGTVALFFNDEDGEPCQTYHTIPIGELGHWISVKVRKPKLKHSADNMKYSDTVIVTNGKYRTSARWVHNTWAGWYGWYDDGDEELKVVTHWMPMPEPPKEGGEK